MPNPIIPKHNDTAGVVPAAASLLANEFCINTAEGVAFVKRPNGEVKRITDPTKVSKTGDESIDGIKTFNSIPIVPNATVGDASNKVASTSFVRESKKVQYWEGVSRSHNTAYLAAKNIALSVLVEGHFMNGIDIAVGSTAGSITTVIGQFGDDINNYTKLASMWVLIPAGMYYQVRPIGLHGFETIVIIEYPFGE